MFFKKFGYRFHSIIKLAKLDQLHSLKSIFGNYLEDRQTFFNVAVAIKCHRDNHVKLNTLNKLKRSYSPSYQFS